MGMLAIVAAIIVAIAWVINATGTATGAWFSVTDSALLSAWRAWPCIRR